MCAWGTGISSIHRAQIVSPNNFSRVSNDWLSVKENIKEMKNISENKKDGINGKKKRNLNANAHYLLYRRRCQLFKQIKTITEMFKHFDNGP